ncbi:helix-turn-helix transcriptional regulator [Micromonospora sp. NPDC094482]|uniref:helix-turn-helix domain-containing protein n=1 Tax=unclassified Micromonospora TaxID=2617518 RepID=UPI0033223D51
MASALDPVPTGPTVGPFPISGLVRRARRMTGLGQRQMARFAKVAPSTVGKVEAGTMTPSYGLARPPETFHRSQYDREVRRRRSQWEVRVGKYRNVPPPPDPRGYD